MHYNDISESKVITIPLHLIDSLVLDFTFTSYQNKDLSPSPILLYLDSYSDYSSLSNRI